MKARHLPDFTIVRHEGRLAILANTRQNRKPLLMWDAENQSGKQIDRDTELEVVKYPAELANLYLRNVLSEAVDA